MLPLPPSPNFVFPLVKEPPLLIGLSFYGWQLRGSGDCAEHPTCDSLHLRASHSPGLSFFPVIYYPPHLGSLPGMLFYLLDTPSVFFLFSLKFFAPLDFFKTYPSIPPYSLFPSFTHSSGDRALDLRPRTDGLFFFLPPPPPLHLFYSWSPAVKSRYRSGSDRYHVALQPPHPPPPPQHNPPNPPSMPPFVLFGVPMIVL